MGLLMCFVCGELDSKWECVPVTDFAAAAFRESAESHLVRSLRLAFEMRAHFETEVGRGVCPDGGPPVREQDPRWRLARHHWVRRRSEGAVSHASRQPHLVTCSCSTVVQQLDLMCSFAACRSCRSSLVPIISSSTGSCNAEFSWQFSPPPRARPPLGVPERSG